MSSIQESVKTVNGLFKRLAEKMEAFNAQVNTPENVEPQPTEQTIPASQKFAELPLEDGSVIVTDTDELKVGSAIKVKNDAGEPLPIDDGEYKCMLPDGSMATIKVEAGIVTAITPIETPAAPEAEQEQSQENPATDNYRAEIDELKAALVELQKQVAALADNNTKLAGDSESSKAIVISLQAENEKIKSEYSKTKEILNETFKVVEALSQAPSVEPTQKPANTSAPKVSLTDSDALRKLTFNR